jgi:hypothetical protein
MTSTFYNNDGDRLSSNSNKGFLLKAKIVLLLSEKDTDNNSTNWNVVHDLLQQLSAWLSVTSANYGCIEDDPMGRLLLGSLLSKNPPAIVVNAALAVFPEALHHNPAAFFIACRDTSPEILALMMRHVTTNTNQANTCTNECCPYPWILSEHVSVEGARALISAYPEGVLKASSMLSGHNLLDYFLFSQEMMEQRNFDMTLWNKFKLLLLATQCCNTSRESKEGLSPVFTILERVLARPGKFADGVCLLFYYDFERRESYANACYYYVLLIDRLFYQHEASAACVVAIAPIAFDRSLGF